MLVESQEDYDEQMKNTLEKAIEDIEEKQSKVDDIQIEIAKLNCTRQ
jgi:hypothetical protein